MCTYKEINFIINDMKKFALHTSGSGRMLALKHLVVVKVDKISI